LKTRNVRMLNSYADYGETFNNQSKGGTGGAGGSGAVGGGTAAGGQLLVDGGELGEEHGTTDFAYGVHHGNGTGEY